MSLYTVNKKIDYLSITVEKTPDAIVGDWYKDMETVPMKNYDKGFETKTGARVFSSTTDKRVGTHIVMSGSALEFIRGEGHTDKQLCEYFIAYPNCKISRIDIAVTSEKTNGDNHELTSHHIHGLANTPGYMDSRLKADKGVIAGDYVETAYIGSRKARNRLFRAYDKGVELDLEAYKIVRYELETRKRANVIVNAIAQGHDIGGIMRRYVDFPQVGAWVEIMGAESSRMPHIETNISQDDVQANKRADRWHWLLTSVAPALAKALYDDNVSVDENENLRLFGLRVSQLHEDMKNE